MKRLLDGFLLVGLLIAQISDASAQEMPLYKEVPNSIKTNIIEKSDSTYKRGKVSNVTNPTLTAFLPECSKANGTAIIICPGGGYTFLVVKTEGSEVAHELAARGIAAFVLKYRLPDYETMVNREIGPLQDAQQAFKIVRENAARWNIDPQKVGVMGFSAGGHLASTASTHYQKEVVDNPLRTSLRPDFSILIYSVISFQDSILHKGTKAALIGEHATREKVVEYSNELQVTADTPPAFLVHASDDRVVPVANSLNYYTALHKKRIKAELHVYQAGGHGFGLNNAAKDKWLDHCLNWLRLNRFLVL